MGFTKSQVQNMDPNVIGNIATGWDNLGTGIEQRFDSYVAKVKNTAEPSRPYSIPKVSSFV